MLFLYQNFFIIKCFNKSNVIFNLLWKELYIIKYNMKKSEFKKQVKAARKSMETDMHIGLADYLLMLTRNTNPKSKLGKAIEKGSAQLAKKITKLIAADQVLPKETNKIKVTETTSKNITNNKNDTKMKSSRKTKGS